MVRRLLELGFCFVAPRELGYRSPVVGAYIYRNITVAGQVEMRVGSLTDPTRGNRNFRIGPSRLLKVTHHGLRVKRGNRQCNCETEEKRQEGTLHGYRDYFRRSEEHTSELQS